MAVEIVGKFERGDRVVVVSDESWCKGCHGVISGVFPVMKHAPMYLVHLDSSPNPILKSSWIHEEGLEKE